MLWDVMISLLPRLQYSPNWLLAALSYVLGYVDGTDIFSHKKVIGSIAMP